MVDKVGSNPTSKGTLPGAHKDIPTLDREVATQAESQVPGFAQAYGQMALQPTALGEASSRVITESSNKLAEKQGYEFAKKDPNRQFLPTFAKSDAAFQKAYESQSSAILGLQASQLMNNNLEQLAQMDRLTPGAIASFKQSSAAGIQGILDNAPDNVKIALSNQYAQHLEAQSHELNMKMIAQQKNEAEQKSQAFRIEQTNIMQDAIRDRTPQSLEVAAQTKADIDQNISNAEAAGQLTAAQAQAARVGNKINYETGLQINNALSARNTGKLEEFITELGDKKLPGLTWSESETVKDNVIKTVVGIEKAQQREHSLTVAQGQGLIQTGQMTPAILDSMQDKLTREEFTRLATSYAVSNVNNSKKSQAVSAITSNPESALVYNGQTHDSINAAFDALTDAHMNKAQQSGTPMNQQEAEFMAASTMNHPVPKYVDGINNALMGGTIDEAKLAMEHISRLHAADGFKTTGITTRAKATAEMFKALQGQYPGDENEALKQAREIVSNKSDEVMALNETRINDELNKHKGARALSSWAVKLGGLGGGDYENLNAYTADVTSRFSAFMQQTNGNVDVSRKLTSDAISKLYAPTYVNGQKQIAYLPIETLMQIPEGGAPLIQSDIIRNIEPQFQQSKAAFDQGNLPSYWRVKEGRVSYEQYAEAKAKINEVMSLKGATEAFKEGLKKRPQMSPGQVVNEMLAPYRATVKEYEAAKPIEVELVSRSGTSKTYTLDVSSSPSTQVSSATGQVVGRYDVGVKDPETGIVSAMSGYFGGVNSNPDVRPDASWVRERYLSVNGLTGPGTHQEQWEAYQAMLKKHTDIMGMVTDNAMRQARIGVR